MIGLCAGCLEGVPWFSGKDILLMVFRCILKMGCSLLLRYMLRVTSACEINTRFRI